MLIDEIDHVDKLIEIERLLPHFLLRRGHTILTTVRESYIVFLQLPPAFMPIPPNAGLQCIVI